VPPILNIIALATFAASLSARALDPVLPHLAADFDVSIASAAGFASVFAFTFAIIQLLQGAAAGLSARHVWRSHAWCCLASPTFWACRCCRAAASS
jgi:predicted MFS family arabinose efflux permease